MGAANCVHGRVVADTSPISALEANDSTVMISGCGNQPVVGYTYCRVHQGQSTDQIRLTLMAPPVKCKTKPCVTFKIFFPSGEPAQGYSVPDGASSIDLTWKDLLKESTFQKNYAGFWQVLMEWSWVDTQGNENKSAALGEIRLRVLDPAYTALQDVTDDKNFAWQWVSGNQGFAMTTAGRAATRPLGDL